MEIKLNGPTAVAAIALFGGFVVYRMTTMQTELETDALEELKSYLAVEYQAGDVSALSAKLETNQPMSADEAQAHVDAIVSASDITFDSVDARGMWEGRNGGEVIVKVGVLVAGGDPPDGERTRYYRMRYRPLAGWKVGARTSVWAYRLKMF